MIISGLTKLNKHVPDTPLMKKALDFLRRPDLDGLPDGRVEIDGDKVFAIIQRYRTAAPPATTFEAHKKYIDIQYMASGNEVIGWAELRDMTITEAYDADKDVCLGTVEYPAYICLSERNFVIFYPDDAHAPKISADASEPVTKVVVKIMA